MASSSACDRAKVAPRAVSSHRPCRRLAEGNVPARAYAAASAGCTAASWVGVGAVRPVTVHRAGREWHRGLRAPREAGRQRAMCVVVVLWATARASARQVDHASRGGGAATNVGGPPPRALAVPPPPSWSWKGVHGSVGFLPRLLPEETLLLFVESNKETVLFMFASTVSDL